jgi:hypothetical protein
MTLTLYSSEYIGSYLVINYLAESVFSDDSNAILDILLLL